MNRPRVGFQNCAERFAEPLRRARGRRGVLSRSRSTGRCARSDGIPVSPKISRSLRHRTSPRRMQSRRAPSATEEADAAERSRRPSTWPRSPISDVPEAATVDERWTRSTRWPRMLGIGDPLSLRLPDPADDPTVLAALETLQESRASRTAARRRPNSRRDRSAAQWPGSDADRGGRRSGSCSRIPGLEVARLAEGQDARNRHAL